MQASNWIYVNQPVSVNHEVSVSKIYFWGFRFVLAIEEFWEASLFYGVDCVVVKPCGIARHNDVVCLVGSCVFALWHRLKDKQAKMRYGGQNILFSILTFLKKLVKTPCLAFVVADCERDKEIPNPKWDSKERLSLLIVYVPATVFPSNYDMFSFKDKVSIYPFLLALSRTNLETGNSMGLSSIIFVVLSQFFPSYKISKNLKNAGNNQF